MIGVFDSGFGGLTVLDALVRALPQYDYLFVADSARAPYGARSLDVIYEFTLESVEWLFEQGCPLVILACNTASTRALRNIQQLHLPVRRPDRRVVTTDDAAWFATRGERLLRRPLPAERIRLCRFR